MRPLNLLRWAGALMLALSLTPSPAVAQNGGTLSVVGTFTMKQLYPTVGADLAAVQPNRADRWWKLTLNGVSYTHDFFFQEDEFGAQYYEYTTRVHATSFAIQFFGPDAAVLNAVVGSQLASGALTNGAFLELVDAQYFEPDYWNAWGVWNLRLDPSDPATGVRFGTNGNVYWFNTDELGYPLVEPQRLDYASSSIDDFRPGNAGSLISYDDIVDLGSDQQPLPPLQVSIADASKLEGDKGPTTLFMTVTLNRTNNQAVSVDYRTNDGTARVSNKDYVRAVGTLTFQPGETSKTIAVTITGDHKREPNETFTVTLSNAVGVAIYDGFATGTILNDD